MKKIIVAPLHWGLGHASRCVPIIKKLVEQNFTPVLASDGAALQFLEKEFPNLESIQLPSYDISYGRNLKWVLLLKLPKILKTIKNERKVIDRYLDENKNVIGIISDNRFGIYSSKIPSVYITHQVNVFSGLLTPLTSFIHQRIIKKYDECWIPDEIGSSYSGKLSTTSKQLNQKFIGTLSRFQKMEIKKEIDVLIVLSGPEPNRSLLEDRIKDIFQNTNQKVWLVRGVIENKQTTEKFKGIKVFNFMLSAELENAINSAKIVICRSGYSTIMDLISLNKRALLIPTKSQNEQEYLAKYLNKKELFSTINEEDLSKESIKIIENHKKMEYQLEEIPENLFRLFNRK